MTARDRQIADLQGALATQQAEAQQRSAGLAEKAAELKRLKQSFRGEQPRRYDGSAAPCARSPRLSAKRLKQSCGFVCLPLRAPLRSNALKHRALMRLSWLLPKIDRRMISDVWLLRTSPLFDKRWYLEQNPDVAKAGKIPSSTTSGRVRKGRNPGLQFDGNWYLTRTDMYRGGCEPAYALYVRQEPPKAFRHCTASAGGIPAYSGPMQVALWLRYHFPALQPLRTFFVPGTPRR